MPQKLLTIDGVGELPFYKRRGSQSVRIRINGNDVRVTMPNWMPYKAAALYVRQRADWINTHRKTRHVLVHGSQIGKHHTLRITYGTGSRFSCRITHSDLNITAPIGADIASAESQRKLESYARRALTIQAEELILPRVRQLANRYNFIVNSIEIKNLKSRWGSCSSKKDLAFSLFLIQLPWEIIDYVIIHELAHTEHMNHSQSFWQVVEAYVPHFKDIRKQLKHYSPDIIAS